MQQIHVCLLGGELMPNILGVLYDKADKVQPMATEYSTGQIDAFREALFAAGWHGEVAAPLLIPPFDETKCFRILANTELSSNALITANWTGGTKPMSYALRRFAEERSWRLMYVNTGSRQLLIQDAPGNRVHEEFLNTQEIGVNNLVHILAAGHTVEGVSSVQDFRNRCYPDNRLVTATDWIIDANRSIERDLRNLSRAYKKPVYINSIDKERLQQLVDASLIKRAPDNEGWYLAEETLLHPFYLSTPQEVNANFLTGTFLEVFIWNQLRRRGVFDDVAWHVQLNPRQAGRVAELDVVAARDGRFVIVECKKSLGGNSRQRLSALIEEQAARARKVGRLFGRWVLYIDINPDDEMGENVITSRELRAANYGGTLIWRAGLSSIHQSVENALSGANIL